MLYVKKVSKLGRHTGLFKRYPKIYARSNSDTKHRLFTLLAREWFWGYHVLLSLFKCAIAKTHTVVED